MRLSQRDHILARIDAAKREILRADSMVKLMAAGTKGHMRLEKCMSLKLLTENHDDAAFYAIGVAMDDDAAFQDGKFRQPVNGAAPA